MVRPEAQPPQLRAHRAGAGGHPRARPASAEAVRPSRSLSRTATCPACSRALNTAPSSSRAWRASARSRSSTSTGLGSSCASSSARSWPAVVSRSSWRSNGAVLMSATASLPHLAGPNRTSDPMCVTVSDMKPVTGDLPRTRPCHGRAREQRLRERDRRPAVLGDHLPAGRSVRQHRPGPAGYRPHPQRPAGRAGGRRVHPADAAHRAGHRCIPGPAEGQAGAVRGQSGHSGRCSGRGGGPGRARCWR